MGVVCCSTTDQEKELNIGNDIYNKGLLSPRNKPRQQIFIRKSFTQLISDGDPEAIAMVARLEGRIRHFMIKRRILKDKKYIDQDRKKYFSTTDYLETIKPKNLIEI